MDVNLLKKEIGEYLNKADDRLLHLIYGMIQADKDADKQDLFSKYSEDDMVKRAEESLRDVKGGKTTKLRDFKSEIEQWKKARSTK